MLRNGETARTGGAPRSPTLSPFVPHGAREPDALLDAAISARSFATIESAGFPTCCIADFQIGRAAEFRARATSRGVAGGRTACGFGNPRYAGAVRGCARRRPGLSEVVGRISSDSCVGCRAREISTGVRPSSGAASWSAMKRRPIPNPSACGRRCGRGRPHSGAAVRALPRAATGRARSSLVHLPPYSLPKPRPGRRNRAP